MTSKLMVAVLAVGTLAGTAGAGPAANRIVVAEGYDLPKDWKPVPILYGPRAMRNDIHLHAAHPELAMFDHPTAGFQVNLQMNDLEYDRDTYIPSNKLWKSYPVKLSEVLDKKGLTPLIERWERENPGCAFSLHLYPQRRMTCLKQKFDLDYDDFNRWCAAHPCCTSFGGIDEYDSDLGSLTWCMGVKWKHPELKERFRKEYGLDKPLEWGVMSRWLDHDFEKLKAYHFGTDKLGGLCSSEIHTCHQIASKGVKSFSYECEHGSVSSPWRWGGAYARGAARQFDVPFHWYSAIFTFLTWTRDGRYLEGTNGIHMVRDSFAYWPNPDKKSVPHLGPSRSLVRRNVRYGYFIGTISSLIECSTYSLYATDYDGKSWTLSPFGKDFNDVFEWERYRDRGVLYSPVAMLVSKDEGLNRQGYNKFPTMDEASIMSFFLALVPSYVTDLATWVDPKTGKEGCLWNSEFGEIVDTLCTDGGQPTEKFTDVLGNYKAAFMIGYHSPKATDTKAIANYVANGGTLFCSYDQVVDGLVSAEQAGLTFGEKTVLAGNALVDERGVAVDEFKEPYTLHVATPKGAKPFLTDELGNVVAWVADAGRGRVVTVTARRMMPDAYLKLNWKTYRWFNSQPYLDAASGKRQFPIVRTLLRRVQRDVLPIDVKGDIQWGLNRVKGLGLRSRSTEDGSNSNSWMLWLINNNGITKFALEPEDIDLKATSTVTVNLKDLKGAKVVDITDHYKDLPIEVADDGTFTVQVKPGEDKRISIRLD